MKKSNKKIVLASSLVLVLITLSGCVDQKNGVPTGEGWVYNLLVEPMTNLLTTFLGFLDGNYGLAIILFTIIIRLIILPLGLYQTKKAAYQSEKMAYLKPQMSAIQERQKAATTPAEQMAANQQLQALYKDNNMSMFGGIGCLPLLVQMPIFTALFYTIKFMPGIESQSFLGINLAERSLLLTALAGLTYLLQSYISLHGVPEEQKKQMQTMMYMSPLMIIFVSFSSPAGVTLYWVVGGIFSCIQTIISTFIQKPKVRKVVEEEFRLNPPKPVRDIPVQDVTPPTRPTTATTKAVNASRNTQSTGGRNAGKQPKK
ncbi:membrane protein insertase YidC [Vagococcus coleopterorum]|uniref:Membrane protein insertase YidC n=1 Tax=Vagococcus coleopterorum TaxID=2714946 RepID=A0A6G8AMY6_9ENTE|nr:membrane protein insertase YidC [Vagococcus coleopterorum]QIL46444.1 membrane protein insertase YidC [Vagococcus coleopterorum]